MLWLTVATELTDLRCVILGSFVQGFFDSVSNNPRRLIVTTSETNIFGKTCWCVYNCRSEHTILAQISSSMLTYNLHKIAR